MKKILAIFIITAAFNAGAVPLFYHYSGRGGELTASEDRALPNFYARLSFKIIVRSFEPGEGEYISEDVFEDDFELCVFPGCFGGGEALGLEKDGVRRRYLVAFGNPRLDTHRLSFDCCTVSCNSDIYVMGNRFRIGDSRYDVTHRALEIEMESQTPALLYKQDFPFTWREKECFVIFCLLASLAKIGETTEELPAATVPINAGAGFKKKPAEKKEMLFSNPVNGLAVYIESDKPQFREHEKVRVKYTFKNVSDKPFRLRTGSYGLDSRLAKSNPDQLIIEDENGILLQPKMRGYLPGQKSSGIILDPGDSYKGAYRITDPSSGYVYYKFKPGRYRMKLVYGVRKKLRIADRLYWTGSVESNTIEIEILEGK